MIPMEVASSGKPPHPDSGGGGSSKPFTSSSSSSLRRPMIQVVAPCDMQAGFCFMANHDGLTFPVQVPSGGVKEGQVFWVPHSASLSDMTGVGTSIIMTEGTSLLSSYGSSTPRADPYYRRDGGANGQGANHGSGAAGAGRSPSPSSIGEWSSSLWDCCMHGPCHPVLWNATCCPLILAAQVMTRLKLNPLGDPSPNYRATFGIVLFVVVGYWALSIWLAPPNVRNEYDDDENNGDVGAGKSTGWGEGRAAAWWRTGLYNGLYVAFGLYTWYVLTKLRAAVRIRYHIPAHSDAPAVPGCVEDACVSFWCGCCSVAQLARQTAPYDDGEEGQASCCSPTGLRRGIGEEESKDPFTERSPWIPVLTV